MVSAELLLLHLSLFLDFHTMFHTPARTQNETLENPVVSSAQVDSIRYPVFLKWSDAMGFTIDDGCGLQGLGLARSVNTTWDATRRGCELARAAGALPCLLPPRRGAT